MIEQESANVMYDHLESVEGQTVKLYVNGVAFEGKLKILNGLLIQLEEDWRTLTIRLDAIQVCIVSR